MDERIKWWQWARNAQPDWCVRCAESGHTAESHFDRFQFDTAGIAELSGVEVAFLGGPAHADTMTCTSTEDVLNWKPMLPP